MGALTGTLRPMEDLDRNGLIAPSLAPGAAPTAGPPPDPAARERRRAPRQRTLLGGKVVHSGGLFSMNCVLRNLSDTGARISLPPGAGAPDSFDLIDLKHGVAFACRVVWRQYPMVGVAFDSRDALDTGDTPRLRTLKRLWLDAITRG